MKRACNLLTPKVMNISLLCEFHKAIKKTNYILMKQIVYLMVFFVLIGSGCRNKTIVKGDAVIYFPKTEHDFGLIEFQKPVTYKFEFSNTGKTPLIINDVRPSCGCTAAEWTKTVIKPEEKGFISVEFDAASLGVFIKQVTVYYNGIGSPVYLTIKGDVTQEEILDD